MADATYAAYRHPTVPHEITLRAQGRSLTTGYSHHFMQEPILIEPPQFKFVSTPPTGPAGQIVLPFDISKNFPFPKTVTTVIIHDTAGANTVPITTFPTPEN